MIQLIEKQGKKYRLKINGVECLFIKDVEVKVVKSLLPPKVLLTALIIKKKDANKKLAAFERHRLKLHTPTPQASQ